MQHIAGAVAAPCAFEGADPDVGRVNREVAIAALTVRAYLQHANRLAGCACSTAIKRALFVTASPTLWFESDGEGNGRL